MTKRQAEKIKAGEHVTYAGRRYIVRSVTGSEHGPKPPYLTIDPLGRGASSVTATYLLCRTVK
jgi:hypothetical protein